MRFNWETGYSYDAGKRLGNFWKILIGEPGWAEHYHDEFDSEEEYADFDGRYPLADFYAGLFEEVWHEEYYEQIQECLIPDDLHFEAMGRALQSLLPYDSYSWEKYFGVV